MPEFSLKGQSVAKAWIDFHAQYKCTVSLKGLRVKVRKLKYYRFLKKEKNIYKKQESVQKTNF